MATFYLNHESELYHHGILGMHWGIRRYQNKDGSLTPAGRKRYNPYGYDIDKYNSDKYEKYHESNGSSGLSTAITYYRNKETGELDWVVRNKDGQYILAGRAPSDPKNPVIDPTLFADDFMPRKVRKSKGRKRKGG